MTDIRFHFKGQGFHDLLADAEVERRCCEGQSHLVDVGSGDFSNGRDSTTQVGRQQVCGEAIC